MVAEFTEIESGKSDTNRPRLQRAIQACWVYGAKLLIAKFDRLSRDAHSCWAWRRPASSSSPPTTRMSTGSRWGSWLWSRMRSGARPWRHQGRARGGQSARCEARGRPGCHPLPGVRGPQASRRPRPHHCRDARDRGYQPPLPGGWPQQSRHRPASGNHLITDGDEPHAYKVRGHKVKSKSNSPAVS
nr:hypothetical protein [Methylobacterium sp. E-046]